MSHVPVVKYKSVPYCYSNAMASPDNGTDEAVEQVNKAVEDGGGCTEAWEALSELRKQNSTNRRDFLRGVGAAGSTAALISAGSMPAVAKRRESSSEEVEAALKSDHVQSLLTELGNPETGVKEATSRDIITEEGTVVNTTIPTEIGDIIYTEADIGGTAAQYHFPDSNADNLPAEYQNIPDETNAGLATEEGKIVFIRGPTEEEQRQLAHLTEMEPDNFIAGFRSSVGGFTVRSLDASQAYRVDLDSNQVETLTDDPISNNSIAPSDGPGWCQACLAGVGGCVLCSPPCANLGPVCYGCVIAFCGAGVRACTKCAQQCGCG